MSVTLNVIVDIFCMDSHKIICNDGLFQMVKSFMEELHKLQMNIDPDNVPVQWNTAVKFLMARKFDIHRALDLYSSHEVAIGLVTTMFLVSFIYAFLHVFSTIHLFLLLSLFSSVKLYNSTFILLLFIACINESVFLKLS